MVEMAAGQARRPAPTKKGRGLGSSEHPLRPRRGIKTPEPIFKTRHNPFTQELDVCQVYVDWLKYGHIENPP
jgi:hypothetical protein